MPFRRLVKKKCIVFSKFYVKSKICFSYSFTKKNLKKKRRRREGKFLKMTEFDNDSHGLK